MLCCILDRLSELLHCHDCGIRMVPRLKQITEQSGPVQKTPCLQRRLSSKGRMIMAFEMTGSQQTNASVTFLDKKGNKAKVDGVPVWSTDNSDALALTPAADGMSCAVVAVGPLTGDTPAHVQINADADLGAGVVEIIGTVEVNIVAGQATVVNITLDTPTDQP